MSHEDNNAMNAATLTQRVNVASENAYVKILSRIILPPVLAVVGFLMVVTLNGVKDDIEKTRTFVSHVAELSQSTHTELQVAKEELKGYRERQEDYRKSQDEAVRSLDLKIEAVRNLLIGQGQGPISRGR